MTAMTAAPLAAVALLGIVILLAVALLRSRARVRVLEQQAEAGAERARELQRLRGSQQQLYQLLGRLPQVAAGLYGQSGVRDVPPVIVESVRLLFEPEEVVVLLRRKDSSLEPGRDRQMVVAATGEGSSVTVGTVVTVGRAELGGVAGHARQSDSGELDHSADAVSEICRRRFHGELAAPMMADGRLLGVVSLARPHKQRVDDRLALRLVAQLSALAMNHLAELSRVQSAADLDALTGVLNKGVLNYKLSEAIYLAEKQGRTVALFIFDLDNFKNYNDRNGHLAGDQLLRQLALLVDEEVRDDDIFGRWGGEEFLLILPGREIEEGLIVAENVRDRIARTDFPHGDGQPLGRVTISGGVACFPAHGLGSSEILQAADQALYESKRLGRNRVQRASSVGLGMEHEEPEEEPEPRWEQDGDDDLQAIRGIGEESEQRLRKLGIRSYRQIADLNWRTAQELAHRLDTAPERLIRERWIEQARQLRLEKYGPSGRSEPPTGAL